MGETVKVELNQYLTFTLRDEVFGLAVDKVREVLEFTTVTRVPQTPAHMCGVINLRGNVVPVIDLNIKFGMQQTEKTVNTCIIVAEIEMDSELTVLGVMVDSVQEVVELEQDQIEPAPKIGTRLNTEFIKGMGKRDEQFVILLDIDRVFSAEELSSVQNATT